MCGAQARWENVDLKSSKRARGRGSLSEKGGGRAVYRAKPVMCRALQGLRLALRLEINDLRAQPNVLLISWPRTMPKGDVPLRGVRDNAMRPLRVYARVHKKMLLSLFQEDVPKPTTTFFYAHACARVYPQHQSWLFSLGPITHLFAPAITIAFHRLRALQ